MRKGTGHGMTTFRRAAPQKETSWPSRPTARADNFAISVIPRVLTPWLDATMKRSGQSERMTAMIRTWLRQHDVEVTKYRQA
jgi:hypothetical protein